MEPDEDFEEEGSEQQEDGIPEDESEGEGSERTSGDSSQKDARAFAKMRRESADLRKENEKLSGKVTEVSGNYDKVMKALRTAGGVDEEPEEDAVQVYDPVEQEEEFQADQIRTKQDVSDVRRQLKEDREERAKEKAAAEANTRYKLSNESGNAFREEYPDFLDSDTYRLLLPRLNTLHNKGAGSGPQGTVTREDILAEAQKNPETNALLKTQNVRARERDALGNLRDAVQTTTPRGRSSQTLDPNEMSDAEIQETINSMSAPEAERLFNSMSTEREDKFLNSGHAV